MFDDKEALKIHLKTCHVPNKPEEVLFTCEVCSKAFDNKISFTRHLTCHHVEKQSD